MNKALCELALTHYKDIDNFEQELKNSCSQKKLDLKKLDTLDNSENCCLFYNYALLLYFNRKYSQCYKVINKIYNRFGEFLDDKLFREINFLYVRLLIHLKQVDI
jgi:hypothetical protein